MTNPDPSNGKTQGKTEEELRREAEELRKKIEDTYRMLQNTQPSRQTERLAGK